MKGVHTESLDVVVLGGGFNGLSSALHLSRYRYDVAVLERTPELGGLARSIEVNDFSVERFYHHYFKGDQDIVGLIEELELGNRLVWCPVRQAVYTQGTLHPFTTPLDLIRFAPMPIPQRIRLGLLTQGLLGQQTDLDDVSTETWVRRNVGDEAYDHLIGPLISAKFGRLGSEISAAFTKGRLTARGSSRGTFRWLECLGYLDGGSQLLVDELCEALRERRVGVETACEVFKIEHCHPGFRITARVGANPFCYEARHVVFTLPAPALRKLVAGFPQDYMDMLERIDFQAVAVAIFGLKRSVTPYYWTSVMDPNTPFNALIEHTHLHQRSHYGNHHVVYTGKYMPTTDLMWSLTDEELMDIFREGLKTINPTLKDEDFLWQRMTRDRFATPIFDVGYGRHLTQLEETVRGFHVGGVLKVYPESRNVNSAVRIGKDIADAVRMLDRVERLPYPVREEVPV